VDAISGDSEALLQSAGRDRKKDYESKGKIWHICYHSALLVFAARS